MPLRLQTEPPLSNETEDNSRAFAFGTYIMLIIALAIIALVLHYRFK